MYLQQLASKHPDKIAAIIADTGETITFGDLNTKTKQLVQFITKNTKKGDSIACLQKNSVSYFSSLWACLQSPFHLVSVNWHLKPDEAKYVLDNSNAVALISSPELSELATEVVGDRVAISDSESFGTFVDTSTESTDIVEVDAYGTMVFYSSGTTGRPKGVLRNLMDNPINHPANYQNMATDNFNITENSVLFSPGPFYHAASGATSVAAQTVGATVISTTKFDPEEALAYIEKYKVTHLMMVPTHLIRMLKLAPEIRNKYDLSSLQLIVHGAAPMPIDAKEELINWLGPIFLEYYATSELIGYTTITTEEWLSHKGSVGKPLRGRVYVVDKEGNELPNGEVGYIIFDHVFAFNYTGGDNSSIMVFDNRAGVGDIGYIDDEQYVYLTDRANNMIITGGVNIYPQEAENVLIMHPAIQDIAVIGVPDSELGEVAKAVVELAQGHEPNDDLKQDIIFYSRKKLSLYKCPRTVDFIEAMPRSETGKLLKKELRKIYW